MEETIRFLSLSVFFSNSIVVLVTLRLFFSCIFGSNYCCVIWHCFFSFHHTRSFHLPLFKKSIVQINMLGTILPEFFFVTDYFASFFSLQGTRIEGPMHHIMFRCGVCTSWLALSRQKCNVVVGQANLECLHCFIHKHHG